MKVNQIQPTKILWILAHPDDEVLSLHLVESADTRNLVVYLTDGVRAGAKFPAAVRQEEARRAWESTSESTKFLFLGAKHEIKDGSLHEDLKQEHFEEIVSETLTFSPTKIISLAFEGGHQDHDVAALFASFVGQKSNVEVDYFPAYCAHPKIKYFYKVMSSRSAASHTISLNFIQRMNLARKAFKLMGIYRTQKSTWVGLGLFVTWKYLFGSLFAIRQPDHFGDQPKKLLYVNRAKSSKLDYLALIETFGAWATQQ